MYRKYLIRKSKSFNILSPETYLNFNWNYIKYSLIILIGYFTFIFNNNETSDLNPNNEANNESNGSLQNNLIDNEQKLKEEMSTISNKFIKEIITMINFYNSNKKENQLDKFILKSKIIDLINSAETLFKLNNLFDKLEHISIIKSDLFKNCDFNYTSEDSISQEININNQNLHEEDNESVISNSNFSESTNNQSDFDEIILSNEKNQTKINVLKENSSNNKIF